MSIVFRWAEGQSQEQISDCSLLKEEENKQQTVTHQLQIYN